jgi:ABC-type polysaccharide/polyol phosphate transport system ATPase subunit
MSFAVEFHHVWKKFAKGEKFDSLRDAIPNLFKSWLPKNHHDVLREREFWAIKDLSFTLPKGGVIGIMGPNGAGKSTVLKLLSGIMSPTKGQMIINGRLSALIEVTAGFHPELTGRENVFLNGTILGMKRKEIDRKFDEIVAFSEVEEFIDTPVKHYSSGMYSRLGFSVAAHMDPEILIVDEVLSVGDVAFQSKCAQKMRQLLGSGSTILLVSHQISLMQSLCKRVLLLDHGQLIKDGPTDEVIPYYQEMTFKKSEEDIKSKIKSDERRVKIKNDLLIDIQEVAIRGADLNVKDHFTTGEDIAIKVVFKARQEILNPIVVIDIQRSDGVLCCSLNSKDHGLDLGKVYGPSSVTLTLPELNLAPGIYPVKISFWDREMIHPYIVHNKNIIRITAADRRLMTPAVFIPNAGWQKETNSYGPYSFFKTAI